MLPGVRDVDDTSGIHSHAPGRQLRQREDKPLGIDFTNALVAGIHEIKSAVTTERHPARREKLCGCRQQTVAVEPRRAASRFCCKLTTGHFHDPVIILIRYVERTRRI